ncbi:phage/plasmid primase, P4 family [Comamonas antarctica]|uniref:phage/plasmid primase, P4 family n=1 Tax=Comamonas antarctica TaxID=2743470 RepID=UPI0028ECC55E|nr:phage/plasmid primase, P4 family [Comamonas antarctica]
MTTTPNIPKVLRDRKQWLVWRLVQAHPKPRKVPFYVNGNTRKGDQGTADDVAQLATFDEALRAVREQGYTGLGFALLAGSGIVALDFDHCVADGQVTDSRIDPLISGTYSEVSPSGTGLRAFFLGDLRSRKDNAGKNLRVGGVAGGARLDGDFDIEVFGSNGFVTITGNHTEDTQLWGLEDTVLPLTDAVMALYRKRFGDTGSLAPAPSPGTSLVALGDSFGAADLAGLAPEKLGWTIEQAREHLFGCSASVSREEWLLALMAIHFEFDGSEEALDLVDEWSATGDSYGGRRDVEGRWRSFGKRTGDAPITGRWLLSWLREQTKVASEVSMREHLAEMQQAITDAPDMVTLQTEVLPKISLLLGEYPMLEIEAYAFVAARAKSLGVSLTKAEFKKLVRAERPPGAASATPLTEFGNTERMLQKYGESIMYCADQGAWFVWTGVYWRAALGGRTEIEHYAKETIRELPKEAPEHSSNHEEFFAFCSISQRAAMVTAMVKLAESDPRVCVPSHELDKHQHLLGVKNGVVDLKTGLLLPPDPALRITRQTDCEYNPGAKCPNFEKALRDAFFDEPEMIDYVARGFGYSLLGNPKEEILFLPFGNGANGKSTVLNAVLDTFGSYGKSAAAESFISNGQAAAAGGAREDLVRLRGARFVYVNEPDAGGDLREGAVKSMTGGDTISARGIHAKASIEIKPSWVIWMPTNHKPIIRGTDNGIWRRLALVPFERDFRNDPNVKEDKGLKDRIAKENAGILAFIVRAALRYQAEGLVPPQKITSAAQEYRREEDVIGAWIDECCEIDPLARTPMKELWESWEIHARGLGNTRHISSSLLLSRKLDSKFPAGKGPRGVRVREGIRIKRSESIF